MYTVNCEYTDTFAGEANYSWVRRASFEIGDDTSDKAVVRRAKKALGLSGVRGRAEWYNGDTWQFRPHGSCTVAFVTVEY